MKTRTENNGITDVTVISADEGKVLVRKGYEDDILGEELWLGYSYYIGGVLQDPPHLDIPADFSEVDMPEDWEGSSDEEGEIEISAEEALAIITGQK